MEQGKVFVSNYISETVDNIIFDIFVIINGFNMRQISSRYPSPSLGRDSVFW